MREKFTVFDAWTRKYLREMILPTGDRRAVVTSWTRRPEMARRFTLAAARNLARQLGGGIVIKNDRGETVP